MKVTASVRTILIIFLFQVSIALSDPVSPDAILPGIGHNPDHWSLPIDAAEPDTFRLSMVNRMMIDPWSMPEIADSVARELTDRGSISELLNIQLNLLDITPTRPGVNQVPELLNDIPKNWPRDLQRAVSILGASFNALDAECGTAPSTQDIDAMIQGLLPWPDESSLLPCELSYRERESDERGRKAFGSLDISYLECTGNAALLALWGVENAVDIFSKMSTDDFEDLESIRSDLATGDVVFDKDYDWGRIVVGGPGETTYRHEAALVIDLGGDDIYRAPIGSGGSETMISICIDLDGNDAYTVSDSGGIAAGIGGIGILVDMNGNDMYRCTSAGLGTGVAGIGVLADFEGDDVYIGTHLTQGSAIFGVGLLLDETGNDIYSADFASQGFAHVGATGILIDDTGSDKYLLGTSYTDFLRYNDHALAMGQGFAFGFRPVFSGGVGLLIDSAGNDAYFADIFGQGASYWYGFGGLIDRNGNDTYSAYQYVQGAGVHLSPALLLDETGNDAYRARGVAQGCGHDLAVGWLKDMEGDDTYTAYDLSQGAGNANGIGILEDMSGNDAYATVRQDNAHGYGNHRRHYGSLGILLDKNGSDSFTAPTEISASIGSLWGLRWDMPQTDMATQEKDEVPADTISLDDALQSCGVFASCDALFVIASRGEPRFSSASSAARDSILALGENAFPCLFAALPSERPRDRWTLEALFRKMGRSGMEGLLDYITRQDTDERSISVALWIMGRMVELEGDSLITENDIQSLVAFADHSSRKVRASLAYVLAESSDDIRIPTLLELAGDSVASVRLDAIRGLSGESSDQIRTILRDAIEDSHVGVAHAAAVAISRLPTGRMAMVKDLEAEGAQLAILASAGEMSEDFRTEVSDLLSTEGASPLVRSLASVWTDSFCDTCSTIEPIRSFHRDLIAE